MCDKSTKIPRGVSCAVPSVISSTSPLSPKHLKTETVSIHAENSRAMLKQHVNVNRRQQRIERKAGKRWGTRAAIKILTG